ncbi:hypothetical protein GYMLUDRAFT_44454 [Collybiopsis luxurians FD-317 M1]|uniref:F-box domain-containing protein n=1 Tax=Collybiopsis luxurians FD-317 M1 TaxID=944289 RepID=A0A0D0CAL3_9AGAR|nr:hypothetical protein GYMLUDRAFT_44454 [Collybiopsis luxurians FD-317 M1]
MSRRRSERIFKRNHRRVPNEISSIIIETLTDNFPALHSLSLVCKDFAALAQPHIFREIDLVPKIGRRPKGRDSLIHRFASLRNHSDVIKFTQRLHFSSDGASWEEFCEMTCILDLLPALISLSIDRPEYPVYQAIEASSISGTLKQLHISDPDLYSLHFLCFQRMLMSLTHLEVLAVFCLLGHTYTRALTLPSSLRVASFMGVNTDSLHAISEGLDKAPLPLLRTLVLGPYSDSVGHVDWGGIGADCQVIYDVGYVLDENDVGAFISSMSGMTTSRIMFISSKSRLPTQFLSRIILQLPSFVREICITQTSTVEPSYQFDPQQYQGEWAELDSALIQRRELGLLKRVCFRCTNFKDTCSPRHSIFGSEFLFGDYGPAEPLVEDRRILDHIENLLPRSKDAGFLEVDRDTLFFEATM